MKINNIYDSWGNFVELTLDQLLSKDKSFWQSLIFDRNLLVLKGLGSNLSDEQFFNLSSKFGNVWTTDVYKLPYIGFGRDTTVEPNTLHPVSYFKSNNNMFSSKKMAYHVDMPHVKEYSWPGRALYMVNNTTDSSGATTWLNLELGWAQCTATEKKYYDGYEVVMQDMYTIETRMEKFPFVKINPKTGKPSPLVNCATIKQQDRAWIHHIEHKGVPLSYDDTNKVINELYQLMESKTNTMYTHYWDTGDMVVYENWFNVHSRTSVNDNDMVDGRLLKRTTFNF
jgi:alpha-ketoglutarate-dependent taurine dioxygenase